jgi:N-acetylglucosaminyldiphosphoundecaprenol N-acetyl-beta-D-mannosaminyltransferase
MNGVPTIRLLGIDIHRIDSDGACDHILAELAAGRGGWVITPNLDILRRLVRDEAFREECAETDLRLADGMPLVWASRLQRTPLPERVAGSDLIWRLTSRAAGAGRSIYLLGGNPGSAEGAAGELTARNPSLRVAGMYCPAFGFENDPAALQAIEAGVVAASPDIVFVGLGSPKQERLIRRLRRVLPRAWFLGVGVSFSFTAGEIDRAPKWMRRVGLEWCHRLAKEPGRLWKRYLLHGLPFAARLFMASCADRFRSPARHPGGSLS